MASIFAFACGALSTHPPTPPKSHRQFPFLLPVAEGNF
jgi:hypothetical protein